VILDLWGKPHEAARVSFSAAQPVGYENEPLCKDLQAGQVQLYLAPMRASAAMPHVPVNDEPGFSLIRDSPVRNAFGGQVIGSTARLRRRTSGSGSPLKSIK
jgi:hypothetical protein